MSEDNGTGTQDSPSVEGESTVPAPPDEVWRALTDPKWIPDWLGDPQCVDPRPGGDFDVELPGGERRSGFFEELTEPERLVFWWLREGEEASRVEIELDELDKGTRIGVIESRPLSAPPARVPPRALALA